MARRHNSGRCTKRTEGVRAGQIRTLEIGGSKKGEEIRHTKNHYHAKTSWKFWRAAADKLKSLGCNPVLANTEDKAINVVYTTDVDLIICDIAFPCHNREGYDIDFRLKAEWPDLAKNLSV